jgi:ABC-2 type transport system ATP-binding protein
MSGAIPEAALAGGAPTDARGPVVVELVRVQARDAAGPDGRPRGGLAGASISLAAGVHAFLGTPEDGTLALADVLTGARAPVRGRVTVAGRAPASTAFLRARIGSLGAEPNLPEARSVREAVRVAMRARGETGDRFDAVLDPLGLSSLQARAPRSLSFAEQRAVELAIALSVPAPILLMLHEPLTEVAMPRLELLSVRLREAANTGACVVLTTSSPSDARSLASHVIMLQKGVVARESTGGGGLVVGSPTTLRAWIHGPGARALCAALAECPEASAVSFREGEEGQSVVEVQSATAESTEAVALALVDAALACGVEIEAIVEDAPTLGEVRSSTEALWKAARAAPRPVLATPPGSAPT